MATTNFSSISACRGPPAMASTTGQQEGTTWPESYSLYCDLSRPCKFVTSHTSPLCYLNPNCVVRELADTIAKASLSQLLTSQVCKKPGCPTSDKLLAHFAHALPACWRPLVALICCLNRWNLPILSSCLNLLMHCHNSMLWLMMLTQSVSYGRPVQLCFASMLPEVAA